MYKIIKLFLVIVIMCLQACQQTNNEEALNVKQEKKKDLSQAAHFNTQLGLGYLKQGDRPRAKRKLLTALKQEPNSPDVNAALAYYYEQTNEITDAKSYYNKALQVSNEGGAQLNNYGAFLCRQGDYKKAESYFMKAVHDPQYINTAAAYENAGLCALEIPDNNKAALYFNTALNQDPSRTQALYELVKLESKMGHDAEAVNLLQKYAEAAFTDKGMLTLAKDVANKAGKYDLALQYDNSLKKMEPNTDNSGANNEYNSNNG